MMTFIAFVTGLAIFLVVYHHLIYPIVLRILGTRKDDSAPAVETVSRRFQHSALDGVLPAVELIVPAYNEAEYIEAKIANLTTLDYPADKIKVVIACDGCSDNTASLAREAIRKFPFCEFPIEVVEHSVNRGKVALLNQHIGESKADVIALSDVSALLSIDSLLIAAGHFEQACVGVVCGYYYLLEPGSEGESRYWQYQRNVKKLEASVGAPLGAHGAFYLFIRELFSELPADTINDDFILPMSIVAQGYRAVYEPRIRALELEHADDSLDRNRRQRIGAGNFQQMLRLKHMLSPKLGLVAFAFASGKALRVLIGPLMLVSLVGSVFLAYHSTLFVWLACLQLVGYLVAMMPRIAGKQHVPALINSLNYLVEGHFSSLLGLVEYVKRANTRQN